MIRILFCLVILFTISIGCGQKDVINPDLVKDIIALHSDEEKRIFLEEMRISNQKLRNNIKHIESVYGYNSKERSKALREKIKEDKINLQKIELYLEKYGHPSPELHGELAVKTPYIILYDCSNLESKQKNFEYLYRAYKKGDLMPNSFAMFLSSYYNDQFDEKHYLP
ncbi:hypothetical protein GCM10009430_10590 [Aquimarina litoralis]|uniref:Lipoprotein n=1 Tax=Aquimarina litoralis TaxID=584605 RepID=A0ABN1IKF0_9FLAO